MASSETSWDGLSGSEELAVKEGEMGGARDYLVLMVTVVQGTRGLRGFARGREGRSRETRGMVGVALTVVSSVPLLLSSPAPAKCLSKWPKETSI